MISAILLAAGSGERTGFQTNKVLKELNCLPVICYSLSAFAETDETIVVCRKQDEKQIKKLASPFPNARTCPGGETRAESVLKGLSEAKGEIVLIHDAARPFITKNVIAACIGSVKKYGSGITAVPAVDTTILVKDGKTVSSHLTRKEVYSVQTPQGFYRKEILNAYRRAFGDGRSEEFTDDGGVYAAYCKSPAIVLGERSNRKLTYAEDFLPDRVGFGVDTHAFYGENEGAPFINFITLAGVRIPSEKIIKAHSDGDVLVHALMDALLSAAGLRDIGYYFPDTDEKYRGADSMQLLEKVLSMVKECGLAPQNVSISVLAQTPRLSPYIEAMKKSLAQTLGLNENAIGIAAGTNEKLGYVGEEKGITCYATVLCSQNFSCEKFS